MPTYDTPGVYWEGRDAVPPAIDAARMDVAGFIGIARKGPLHTAVPVDSLRQFEAHFGSFTEAAYLAYVVKGFFDNGGRRVWVVRVATAAGDNAAAAATLEIALPPMPLFPAWPAAWQIAASSPGSWGNALDVSIRDGTRIAVTALPAVGGAESLTVLGTAGFDRDSLVRISQPGKAPLLRILAGADAAARRLLLVNPEPRLRRDFEAPLTGFDPTLPLLVVGVSYTILVREAGIPVGLATDLSLVPGHPRYAPAVLAATDYAASIIRAAPPAAPFPIVVTAMAEASAAALPLDAASSGAFIALTGGRDGLAELRAVDFIGVPFPPEASLDAPRKGLQVFEQIAEPAVLAVPDILIRPAPDPEIEPPPVVPPDPCAPCPQSAAPAALRPRPQGDLPPVFSDGEILQVQQALIEHCESRRDRIALIDAPYGAVADRSLGVAPVQAWRAQFDSRCGAFYAPWLQISDPILPGSLRAVPSCGHVAGQYALVEALEGVHRAPANLDLAWAEAVTLPFNEVEHGLLNTVGINLIRPELGRALRILGARTLSSDPAARFVPVRRVIMLLLRTFERATQWAVFEPNDHRTRSNLAVGFGNFLSRLWQLGALAGDSPEAGFALRCDETNNPAALRDNGQLVCDIAVAPVDPLEFIVLRIGRADGELEVREQSVRLQEATA
jgi:phage tail sheath protein FI